VSDDSSLGGVMEGGEIVEMMRGRKT